MDTINQYYNPITISFLDRNWPQGFDIYYIENQYLRWLDIKNIIPDNLEAHFLQFVRTHVERNPGV